MIDKDLRWNYHINNVVFTYRGLLFKLRFLQQSRDVHNLKMVNFAFIECGLKYVILSWRQSVTAEKYHLRNLPVS